MAGGRPKEGPPLLFIAVFGKGGFVFFYGFFRPHFPSDRNYLRAHLTLFHHLPPSVEGELSTFLKQVTRDPAPVALPDAADTAGQGRVAAAHHHPEQGRAARGAGTAHAAGRGLRGPSARHRRTGDLALSWRSVGAGWRMALWKWSFDARTLLTRLQLLPIAPLPEAIRLLGAE